MRHHKGLRPQDIVVLLKILLMEKKSWRHLDLAFELGLSQAEITYSLDRLKESQLIATDKKSVNRAALLEFIIHGVKYVFPVAPGAYSRGIPTAHSTEPLSLVIVQDENNKYVWPYAKGKVRGQSIEPLYISAVEAAAKDQELHSLLALVDALRAGRARERKLAAEELTKIVKAR
jgi:hypothetical protein